MSKLLKIIWRVFWNLKTILITGILLCSLAINMLLFVGGPLFLILNNGFEALTGIQTIASRNKAEIADLGEEVVVERNAKRKLKGQLRETSAELANSRASNRWLKKHTRQLSDDLFKEKKAKRALRNQLSKKTADLATSRIISRQLRSTVRGFAAGRISFKGKKVAIKTAINETADTIGKRAVKTAKREVASMPAEAIPYLGTAIIAGVTALEIYDLCATLKDMSALKRAFNPDLLESEEELEVCSIKVPPKEEILATVKASPLKAWNAANEALPSWSELKQLEVPDVNWSEMWSSAKEGSTSTWDSTSESVNEFGNKVKKWWEAD